MGRVEKGFLGDLEQMVLLAVLRLGDEAYGVTIRGELVGRAGRKLSRGALYTCLERLEAKGLVSSRLGEPIAERGGRPRRYYSVSAAGLRAVRHATRAMQRLGQGLESILRNAP